MLGTSFQKAKSSQLKDGTCWEGVRGCQAPDPTLQAISYTVHSKHILQRAGWHHQIFQQHA